MTRVRSRRRPPAVIRTSSSTRYSGAYVANEAHYVIRGRSRSTRGAVPVIWGHGALDTADTSRQGTRYNDLRAIAAAGLPVLAGDLGGQSWANTTAVGAGGRIDQLIAWGVTNLGTRTDRVVLAGESMGTLLAMNWAWRNHHRVAALWLRAPVTHFQDFYNRTPLFQGAIDTAHGGAPVWASFDPLQNRAALTGLGTRTRIDAATEDEFLIGVQTEEHAHAVGAELHWVHGGTHIDVVHTPPDEIADWIVATVNRW